MGQEISLITRYWWHSKIHSSTVDYVNQILSLYPCNLKSSKARKTKLGDFRVSSKAKVPVITINNDLSPSEFLVTLVHEIAHLHVWNNFGRKVRPHGVEWKSTYVQLLSPLMDIVELDSETKMRVREDILNPRASCKGSIGQDEPLPTGMNRIEEVLPGQIFEFRKREFTMIKRMRTRFLCLQNSSGRKYAFQAKVIVKITQKSK